MALGLVVAKPFFLYFYPISATQANDFRGVPFFAWCIWAHLKARHCGCGKTFSVRMTAKAGREEF